MSAPRFHGRKLALTALCGGQLALAWAGAAIVTLPLLAPLRRHPDGLFALYADGGRSLMELADTSRPALTLALTTLGLLATLYAALWMALGATLPVLAVVEPAPSLHRAASYSIRRLPTLAGLAVIALLGYALAAATGLFAWRHFAHRAEAMVDVRAGDLLQARAAIPALLLAALVTVWHDVARVWAAGSGEGIRASAADAFVVMLRAPLQTLGRALAYALAGALGVAAAYLASRLLGGRDGAALVALTLVQQGALAWRFAFRARWMMHLGALFRARATPLDETPAEAPPEPA